MPGLLREGRVTANGLRFAYLERGSGPLVVFLHGWPDTPHTWDYQLAALAGAGFPMTTAAPSTALATIQPAFRDAERLAFAGYLAGYRVLTRDAYLLLG